MGQRLAYQALACAAAAGAVLIATAANARLTEIKLEAPSRSSRAMPSATVGPYVRIKGVARASSIPPRRENAAIVDLDKAPRNAPRHGRIRGRCLHPASGRSRRRATASCSTRCSTAATSSSAQRLHDLVGGSAALLNDPKSARACRQRLSVRARLHRGVVGLGSRRAERATPRMTRALSGGDGERQADGAPHPRGVSGRQARGRRRRSGAAALSGGLDRQAPRRG